MIGVATSDLHLGFRAFPTSIENGRSAREQDVERAWAAAVDEIVLAQPDLVTIAGDVFHNTRPSFHAVRMFQRGIRRVIAETRAEVVIILGNHEAPKTAETLSPVVVVEGEPRVHVVSDPYEQLTFTVASGELVSVTCFPFAALAPEREEPLRPNPAADVNVLLMHAAVRSSADGSDSLPFFYGGTQTLDLGHEAENWDVIAVGDYHDFRRLHPRTLAFYSGAIELTSSNIWDESPDKGIVQYDTRTRFLSFRRIHTRRVLNLRFDDKWAGVPSAEQVNHALQDLVDNYELDGAVVRYVIDGFPRSQRNSIDQALIRKLRQHCFHFYPDIRYHTDEVTEFGDRRERRSQGIGDEAAIFFASDKREVRDLADEYLVKAVVAQRSAA